MKEKIIKEIEKVKASLKDIDNNIKMIDALLSAFDNVSIDELPTEIQENLIILMKQRNELIHCKIKGLNLIKISEAIISGE